MGETGRKTKKIYYSMGEVSEMFDVNPSLIRFWEQKFSILKPEKNKKGNRLFTQQDVDNLKLIYHLVKENGMTLAGAQKRLKENREGLERNLEIIERLQAVKALLLEVRQELKEADTRAGEILVDDLSGNELLETTDLADAIGSVDKIDSQFIREPGRSFGTEPGPETRPEDVSSLAGEVGEATMTVSASQTGPREQPLFPDYVGPEQADWQYPSSGSEGALEVPAAGDDPSSAASQSAESSSSGKRMQVVEQTLF